MRGGRSDGPVWAGVVDRLERPGVGPVVSAQVLPFACLDPYPTGPTYGPTVIPVCARQRWHAGDHRATVAGSGELLEWPDPPAPPNPEDVIMTFGDRHAPGAHLDEQTETWEPVTLEGHVSATRDEQLWRAARILAALIVAVALVCAPAVVIAVYRAAL